MWDRRVEMERRNFLKQAAAALAGWKSLAGRGLSAQAKLDGAAAHSPLPAVTTVNGIGRRKLGRADVEVSIIGIGGYHIGLSSVSEAESIRIVRKALDEGINFLDNCWDYNDGESEIRVGRALRDGYRKKAFLMTKIDGRDKKTAEKQINESLKRLQTDRIDLLQFHEVIRDTDADRIFAAGGAMEAVLEAKKAGKVRFIGFTGHKSPDFHLKMLSTASAHQFTFDSVQMPLNVMDAHF